MTFKSNIGLSVYYDDSCGFCDRSIRIMKALDWFGLLYYEPSRIKRDNPPPGGLDKAFDQDAMIAANAAGQHFWGFDACVAIGKRLPLTSIPSFLLGILSVLPPVKWLGRAAYKKIADSRYAISCKLKLPPPSAS